MVDKINVEIKKLNPLAFARMLGVSEIGVVLVGAGHAGLAVAACLKHRGIPHVHLERAESVGAAWRRHYERLHLHTTRRHSSLPLMPMPSSWPKYPSRAQVVEYLERYAAHFDIRPQLGQEVRRIAAEDGRVRDDEGGGCLIQG